MIEIVDVSRFQVAHLVDWSKAKELAKVAAAMVKSTEGIKSPDPAREEHCKNLTAAKIPYGLFHYLMVRHGPQDAAAQADEFIESYLDLGATLPPAVDCEDQENLGRDPGQWQSAVRAFVERVHERLGVWPMFYSYPWFYRSEFGKLVSSDPLYAELAACPLWWASYRGPVAEKPLDAPKPWAPDGWALWQYRGDEPNVSGFPGLVDLSRSRLSVEDLRKLGPALKAKQETKPAEPSTSPEPEAAPSP